jgi:hypothetical protein
LRSALAIYYGEQEGRYPVDGDGTDGQTGVTGLGSVLTQDHGKYIKEMPSCYAPPHHVKTIDVTAANTAADTGNWGYRNDPASPAAGEKIWGDLWVDCSQTDSRGTVWSLY